MNQCVNEWMNELMSEWIKKRIIEDLVTFFGYIFSDLDIQINLDVIPFSYNEMSELPNQ